MKHSVLLESRDRFHQFVKMYEPLLRRKAQRSHLNLYLKGLVSMLERKSIEPIALAQGADVRRLQDFIGASPWDSEALLVEHRRHVRETLGSADGVLILDKTSFPKRGDKSVGVARQWCGQRGKVDNCQIGVNLAYVSEHGHAFLDRRLYLPEDWARDMKRRKACGVPEHIEFRTSWHLGYEMVVRTQREKFPHSWITGDEEFGKATKLHDWLSEHGERWIFEIPKSRRVHVAISQGKNVSDRERAKQLRKLCPGRPRFARSDRLKDTLPNWAWSEHTIRAASKGPVRVAAAFVRVRFHRNGKRFGPEGWLIITRTLDKQGQVKYFQSNAPANCGHEEMLRAAFARWAIEEDHGQGKNETGLGHYETRSWLGWHHHTALSFIAHHFLVIERNRMGKKISRDDNRGSAARDRRGDAAGSSANGKLCQADETSAETKSRCAPLSLEVVHDTLEKKSPADLVPGTPDSRNAYFM